MEQQNFLQSIAYALPHFAHPNATEQSVYDALIAYGIDSSLAERIIIFTPTAFGRVLMRHLALAFPSTYRIENEAGQLTDSLLLAEEPVFCAALQLAVHLADADEWQSDIHDEVAYWSAEAGVVSQALVEGYNPQDLKLQELIVHWHV
ncbi:hypothetical protein [Hymenobacter jeollabukensis]|uniref:Uncharacterized protein n=1 Tax=Hymenobacter jeollabukensis TaxID=2025313 RepID=A0A5R8WQ79_9BACT|nr:hypothetical protein [Hymenobacter jeollabukensis]TLM91882.1 hypothetical protein FDY95_15125 [Hymenobacter jeollabukensis]